MTPDQMPFSVEEWEQTPGCPGLDIFIDLLSLGLRRRNRSQ